MEQGGPSDQDHGQEVKLIKKAVIPLLVDIYKDCKDDETKKSSNSFTTRKPAEGMDRSKKPRGKRKSKLQLETKILRS